MSDVVNRPGSGMVQPEGDLVDLYIARTEELRRIAAEEEASDRLVFAYDARRQAAVALMQGPGDAVFRLADRRPDLAEQVQADVGAQDVIDATQRPPSASAVGGGGAQALADARSSLEELRQAALAPDAAEAAARARGLVERDAERILSDVGTLYAASRQAPGTARGMLATVYEPAEMEPGAIAAAGRSGERWQAADAQAAEAAARQDPDALSAARRAREIETAALLENRLGIYALARGPQPLSARAEMALDAEARSLMGAAPGTDAEIDRDMQQALGAKAGDPAARYAWLAEEAMAADSGARRVRLAPRLRARAKAEAQGIEAARLDPSLGDRLGVARLAALAKEGRPWLARAFGNDRKPDEPLRAAGTAGRTPDLDDYAAEQAASAAQGASKAGQASAGGGASEQAGPRAGQASAGGGASEQAGPKAGQSSAGGGASEQAGPKDGQASADGASERVTETEPGYAAYTAKRIDPGQEGSVTGLVAAVMPKTDAELAKMLGDKATPAFALPLAKWSGSKTIDRELTQLYKRDPKQFWSLFEGSRNLSLAILKKPGGLNALSEAERMAFDELQLGLRAIAKVAVYQNAKEHAARVEEPLQALLSANGKEMVEKGKRNARYAAALRDPDGVIEAGRKDEFTERLAKKGLIPSLKETMKQTAKDINRVAGLGLLQKMGDAFIDEAAR